MHRMSNVQFFQSVMGNRFFSAHVPQALQVAERIANALERIAAALEAQEAAKPTGAEAPHAAVQCPPSSP
jgi:hypothetical protein